MCLCVCVCVCVRFFTFLLFFATGANLHQSGIEVRCAKSANFSCLFRRRIASQRMFDSFLFSGDLCSPTPAGCELDSWMSKGGMRFVF